eukprot:452869_1
MFPSFLGYGIELILIIFNIKIGPPQRVIDVIIKKISICFNGMSINNQPNLAPNIIDFKFEPQFIRMIQIDVNISEITGIKRAQPLEKEAFWILTQTLRKSHNETNKYQCFNKMCCVLSVYSSTEYNYVLEKYKQEICIIIKNQKRPLNAAISLYDTLKPKQDTDIIALIDLIAEFVKSYTPTNKENALHSLKILLQENKLFSQHIVLLNSTMINNKICYKM